jgi:hypothetical protein
MEKKRLNYDYYIRRIVVIILHKKFGYAEEIKNQPGNKQECKKKKYRNLL